ncbi:MAG TPA: Crp/Fnr family transcriptional regulator [Rickettsiales bacterium]|nr:Crp/Fnr family transcriptional regulator [Rickettsiales bacterium]
MERFTLTPEHFLFREHPKAWETIAPHIKTRIFSKGENLACHGDAAQHFFILLHGWVRLTRQTPDGKETVVGLCAEGDFLGEASLFPHASYPSNMEVVDEHTQVAMIPAKIIRETVNGDKAFSNYIMALLNDRLAKTQLKLEHLSTLTAAQRMGCFLLNLCRQQTTGRKAIDVPVEKNIIAAYLGMKPETFSRSLQQLKEIGVNAASGKIVIDNVERLRDYVCNSCSEAGMCDTATYIKQNG